MGIQTENHRSMGKSEEISQICLGRDSDGDSMRKIAKFCLFLSKDKNYGVALFRKRVLAGISRFATLHRSTVIFAKACFDRIPILLLS